MKKIKAQIIELGLSPKKEAAKMALCCLLFIAFGVVLYLLRHQIFLLFLPLMAGIVFLYYQLTSYQRRLAAIAGEMENEFVRIFTYFSIYIGDGFNVYVCLQKVLSFASGKMKTKIEKLLSDIDEDKSVTPFIAFSLGFENVAIKEVMISVYQMVDEGTTGAYLTQFSHLFGRLSDAKHNEEIEKKNNRLDTLSFLPLAASGIAMIALVIALMDIMGEAFNVI